MDKIQMKQLMDTASQASKKAYCPYSEFPVGAAVLTTGGHIFTGCNVENASFGLTVCAEQTAIVKAVSEGSKDIVAVAVFSPREDVTPCGACRQFILEFGSEIQVVHREKGILIAKKIKDLLPQGFTGP